MTTPIWSGSWLHERLAVTLVTETSAVGLTLPDLVGLALRNNARRAQLLVSPVLGKHVPCDPNLVYGSGRLLGALVASKLEDRRCSIAESGGALIRQSLAGAAHAALELIGLCERDTTHSTRPDALVLGYAETATSLGHCVAEAVGADYLHSTRRSIPGLEPATGFSEEHSHATAHLLLPAEPNWLRGTGPVVLVDDEISTGRTALNTVEVLQSLQPRRY